MKTIHYHITAIFLYGMAVLILDYLRYYYYFERFMLSGLIIYGLMSIVDIYRNEIKQWFISAMLACCLGWSTFSFMQNLSATIIYLSNTKKSLRLVEEFIYKTQVEWISCHYLVSGIFGIFVFFYFVVNWDKWLRV